MEPIGKRDLPTWVYRAGLVALAGIIIWQANETLVEVRRINERQIAIKLSLERVGARLDWHDKAITDQAEQMRRLEFSRRGVQ